MTVYICTTGTSAGKHVGSYVTSDWVAAQGGIDNAASKIHESLAKFNLYDPAGWKTNLPAEAHSLAQMDLNGKDEVYLLASDTDDGKACAHAIELYLMEQVRNLKCQLIAITGLQVMNEARLRTVGIVNFVNEIVRLIKINYSGNCVLNPTAGYKALVPYASLIGMIKKVPVKYIFEHSNSLLSLPPFPIEFSHHRLGRIKDLMAEITDVNAFISQSRYHEIMHAIKNKPAYAAQIEDINELECLFEVEKDKVKLSAIGAIVYNELREPYELVPFLSRPALAGLVKVRQIAERDPEAWLKRQCRLEKNIERSTHFSVGENIVWLKHWHSEDRYLVSREDWRLLVWEIVEHQQYERFCKNNSNNQLGKKLKRERQSKYAPFSRMELCD